MLGRRRGLLRLKNTLLSAFLDTDATPDVRAMLRVAASEVLAGTPPGRRMFNFNCYDVTLDAEAGSVLLEDVLDASPAGTAEFKLAEFVAEMAK